jgi:protein-S-isoprenylcysteine O-methyltransferase Ste14
MWDLLDALVVTGRRTRLLVAASIWLGFGLAMVGLAAAQAGLEAWTRAGPTVTVFVVIAVWALWTLWHSVLFARHREQYLATRRHPYRRAFIVDIFPSITIGFSQMLRSVWNGPNLRAGRVFPHLPARSSEAFAITAGWVTAIGAFALFLAAWRTLGASKVGFVSEFVEPEHFQPVRSGPYGYVRHPLFWSGIATCWAGALLSATATGAAVAAVNTGYGLIYNRLEDRRLARVFGDRYGSYAREVPRIVPVRRSPVSPTDSGGATYDRL